MKTPQKPNTMLIRPNSAPPSKEHTPKGPKTGDFNFTILPSKSQENDYGAPTTTTSLTRVKPKASKTNKIKTKYQPLIKQMFVNKEKPSGEALGGFEKL